METVPLLEPLRFNCDPPINWPIVIGPVSVGEVARTTFPVPVDPKLPKNPPLLYKIFPNVPPVMVVEPISRLFVGEIVAIWPVVMATEDPF
jgi:hypothetical protein